MKNIEVKIKNTTELPLPQYQTAGAAGFDFFAAVTEAVTLQPGDREIIPTGLYFAIPLGYELQVRARSGLAAKYGIGLANSIGTIDSDYRGEILVILINHGDEPFTINRGDRIAQGIIAKHEKAVWEEVDDLDETERNHGRFGSTGHKIEKARDGKSLLA